MTNRNDYRIGSETKAVAEILHQGRFEVPWHQREYDWETRDVERFWNDIIGAQQRGAKDYFVGSIVLTRQTEALYHIQDGQQRLVTYSLMCAALRGVFEKRRAGITDARVQECQKIIFGVSPTGIISQSQVDRADLRINASPKNRDNFQHIARNRQLEPNGKFRTAWRTLSRKANRLSADEAHDLLDYLTKQVIAVEITSAAENATEVFETLNDRGKHLEDVDLVRNYLYSHFGTDFDNRHDEVHGNLIALRDQFSGKNAVAKMAEYVRCYMHCRYGFFNVRQMHKGIREAIEKDVGSLNANETKNYVHRLTLDLRRLEHISVFLALDDGDTNAEIISQFVDQAGSRQHHRNMKNFVAELQEYSVTRPILYAILTQFQRAEGAEKGRVAKNGNLIARNLTSFLMRTTTVVDKFSPSTVQEEFSGWGHQIHNKITQRTPREFATALKKADRNQIWSDSEFRSTLSNLRVSNKKALKVLLSLYSFQQNDLIQQNTDRLSVEHILPESPNWLTKGDWPDFNSDEHALHYNKLGNLTLMAVADNRGGEEQNESFTKKVLFLKRSTLKENLEVAKCIRWTPQTVQQRQARLGRLSCQVWPLADR